LIDGWHRSKSNKVRVLQNPQKGTDHRKPPNYAAHLQCQQAGKSVIRTDLTQAKERLSPSELKFENSRV